MDNASAIRSARRLAMMAAAALTGATLFADDLPLYTLNVNDNDGQSAFTNSSSWVLKSDTSQVATEAPNADNDYIVLGNRLLRSPEPKAANARYTFGGHALHMGAVGGDSGNILIRNSSYATDITFANEGVYLHRGTFGSWNAKNADIRGKITVDAAASAPVELFCSGGNNGTLNIYAPLYGSGHLWIHTRLVSGSQGSTDMRCTFHDDALKGFTGTINTYWCQYRVRTGGKSTDGYSQTFISETGSFPGHLRLWPGSAYEGYSPTSVFTVNKLTLDNDAVIRVTADADRTSSSMLCVNGALTAASRLYAKMTDAPTRSAIITGAASAPYAFDPTPVPFLCAPAGTDLSPVAAAFNHSRSEAEFPSYHVFAGTYGDQPALYIEPEFTNVVRMTGSNDGYGHNSFSGTGKDSPSSWCDGLAPTNPSCIYVISGKEIRNELRTTTGKVDKFKGGALVTCNTSSLTDAAGGAEVDDLRVFGKFTIMNVGSRGTGTRFADFPSYVTEPPFQYKGRYRMNVGYDSSSCFRFTTFVKKAMDISAEISGVGRMYLMLGMQSNVGNFDGYIGLFGINTNFTGQVYVSSDTGILAENGVHVYIRDPRNLGGPRVTWMSDALTLARNSYFHPLESMTLDTANFGIRCHSTSASNVNTFHITNGVTFACKCRFTRASIMRKTGGGTFALGGAHPYYGSDTVTTATAISNRFDILEGAIKPLSSEAFQGLELTMAEGAEIHVDIPASALDGDVGQYGMRNTEWTEPFVLPEDGVTVRLADPDGNVAKGVHEAAIATVVADKVGLLRGKLNLAPGLSAGLAGYSPEIRERTNTDGTVTFYAKLSQGMAIIVR